MSKMSFDDLFRILIPSSPFYTYFQQYLTIFEKVLADFINFGGQGMAALTDLLMAVGLKWGGVETWYLAILFIIKICNTSVSLKKIWEHRGGSGSLIRGMTLIYSFSNNNLYLRNQCVAPLSVANIFNN